jgi:hypothetical protein
MHDEHTVVITKGPDFTHGRMSAARASPTRNNEPVMKVVMDVSRLMRTASPMLGAIRNLG